MHIFISYSKKDTRELAISLSDALNQIEGLTAWVDRSLRARRSWELQIETEIDRCDAMVVLYSPDINRHKQGQTESYVLTEIAYAMWTAKKPIIPVMAQQTDPPISLTMHHYVDFTIQGLALDDLVRALCIELDVEANPKPTSPQPKPDVGAKRASSTQTETTAEFAEAIRNIIGDPFDLCEVPAGEFLYGDDNQKLALPDFAIAKYPITYAQFQIFVEARDGFYDGRWWQGLAINQHTEIGEQVWKIPNHPRERVSWYDAMAFCRWLSHKLNGETAIDRLNRWSVRLPTEYEWEKAARGTEGSIYSYGNGFVNQMANTEESYLKKTTPVTAYPKGSSPYGVMDMSGNVRNWCLSSYSNSKISVIDEEIMTKDLRVSRGGSWSHSPSLAQTFCRHSDEATSRSYYIGFRIVCPVATSA